MVLLAERIRPSASQVGNRLQDQTRRWHRSSWYRRYRRPWLLVTVYTGFVRQSSLPARVGQVGAASRRITLTVLVEQYRVPAVPTIVAGG